MRTHGSPTAPFTGTTADTLRILIADEQALLREAVRTVLDAEDGLSVVAEAGNRYHAVREAERTRPHVAIIDAALPDTDGVRAGREIVAQVPGCRFVVLSPGGDPTVLRDAIEAGAAGFVTTEAPLSDLIEAVRAVGRDEVVVPPTMLGALLHDLFERRRQQDDAFDRISHLTDRELQVLRLLVGGADNDGIGHALGISPQTARTHVQKILAKLQVHSRLEAAALVTRDGILDQLGDDDALSPVRARRRWRGHGATPSEVINGTV